MKNIASIIFLLVLGSCAKQSATSSKLTSDSYKDLAYENLVEDSITFIESEKKDYVLATCFKNSPNIPGSEVLNYVVINIETGEIEREGKLPNGRISWISEYELQIFSPPGIIQSSSDSPDDYLKIYNIKTHEFVTKKGASH